MAAAEAAKLAEVVQGELGRWILSKGIASEDLETIVGRFIRPGIEVKDLRTLFALDPEDVDQVLEGVPMGSRKLIKKAYLAELPKQPEGAAGGLAATLATMKIKEQEDTEFQTSKSVKVSAAAAACVRRGLRPRSQPLAHPQHGAALTRRSAPRQPRNHSGQPAACT